MSRRTSAVALTAAVLVAGGLPLVPASASTTGSVSGVAFEDVDRDGVRDVGEAALSRHVLYLFDAAGAYAGQATTAADGTWSVPALTHGTYRVEYSPTTWSSLRTDWTPTTTGSLRAVVTVAVDGAETVHFGWRRITRSRTAGSPLSAYTGPSGLRVESYNDVVNAREVHDAVAAGTVGAEAPHVLIRFDLSDVSSTTASWQGSPGSFSGYSAVSYDNWTTWVEQGDWGVSHEYGHAWAGYFDTVVQQDGTLRSYLRARGLEGDPRVGTSYGWNPAELIAEDYRQLLGSPTARLTPQANRELPAAADVPGLREFLTTTFQTPPAASEPPAPPPLDAAPPVVNPAPVTKSASVASSVTAPASVTVEIRTARGDLVRTLVSGRQQEAGPVSAGWDRKDARGRRVAAGDYTAVVVATGASGTVARSTVFRVA